MKVRSLFVGIVLVVTACAPAQPTPSPSPAVPSAAPVASPSEVPSPPAATPSPSPAAWAEVFGQADAVLHDLVAGPSGLIAVGCVRDSQGNCVQGLMLTSPDGILWTQVDLEAATNVDIWSVMHAGGLLFALGSEIDDAQLVVRAAVWTSLDGQAWSRARSASFAGRVVQDVVESPAGIIGTGIHAPYASEGGGFVVWDVAADGSFGPATDIDLRGQLSYVDGVAWAGAELLAWGLGGGLGEEVRSAVLMTSADGRTWDIDPGIAAFHAGGIRQIVAIGDRLVAVGFSGSLTSTSPAAWTRGADGSWVAADVPPGEGVMNTVGVEGAMLVARGTERRDSIDHVVSWASADGTTWARLADNEDLPDLAGFHSPSRATIGTRTCAAGTLYEDSAPPVAEIYCR